MLYLVRGSWEHILLQKDVVGKADQAMLPATLCSTYFWHHYVMYLPKDVKVDTSAFKYYVVSSVELLGRYANTKHIIVQNESHKVAHNCGCLILAH